MLNELKESVFRANKMLVEHNLITFTWGNASGYDQKSGLVVIKPSGVEYRDMTPDDMVIVDMEGKRVEGTLRPSSDTPTHLEIYKAFPEIGGVVHTHSRWATIFAQMGMNIPALGTTHADCFLGEIPCTRKMTPEEIANQYERNTGLAIVKCLREQNEKSIRSVLVHSHGPFSWGEDSETAAYYAVVLEEIAMMAWFCMAFPKNEPIQQMQEELMQKHYFRKHGESAYYGQRKEH